MKPLYEVHYRCDQICYMFFNRLNKADRIQTLNFLGTDGVYTRPISK